MMEKFFRSLFRCDEILARGEAWALIGLVSVMTLIVFLQVIYRYILTEPLHWSEEMARYLFVWLSLLGATLAFQRRGHFGFEILVQRFSPRNRRVLGVVIHLLTGFLLSILLVQGIRLCRNPPPWAWPWAGRTPAFRLGPPSCSFTCWSS
jgi:TRAP-type C4-dicarboxylate transport system permease small subunit